jgi:hypothetical protein
VTNANDSLIATARCGPQYTPTINRVSTIKTTNEGGGYTLTLQAGCDNALGCNPSLEIAHADFLSYVATGVGIPEADDMRRSY